MKKMTFVWLFLLAIFVSLIVYAILCWQYRSEQNFPTDIEDSDRTSAVSQLSAEFISRYSDICQGIDENDRLDKCYVVEARNKIDANVCMLILNHEDYSRCLLEVSHAKHGLRIITSSWYPYPSEMTIGEINRVGFDLEVRWDDSKIRTVRVEEVDRDGRSVKEIVTLRKNGSFYRGEKWMGPFFREQKKYFRTIVEFHDQSLTPIYGERRSLYVTRFRTDNSFDKGALLQATNEGGNEIYSGALTVRFTEGAPFDRIEEIIGMIDGEVMDVGFDIQFYQVRIPPSTRKEIMDKIELLQTLPEVKYARPSMPVYSSIGG